jgi:hypothetical protein
MSMALSFSVEVNGPFDALALTDRQAMIMIGNAMVAIIRDRTVQGVDAQGRPFKDYSTDPINIPIGRGTGFRLTPKGGEVSRTGRSMRFKGGYAEYKRKSRKPGVVPIGGASSGTTSEVDLTLSGQLMRSVHVAQATDDAVVVQTGDGTAAYAGPVNDLREFMGIAPSDYDDLEAAAADAIEDALRRKGWAP